MNLTQDASSQGGLRPPAGRTLLRALSLTCAALCLVGSAARGKDWVFTGVVTGKTDWQADGTHWNTVFVRIPAPELPFQEIRFIFNPLTGRVDPERCNWMPELPLPPFTNQLAEAQLPRLKCPVSIPALVSARMRSRCRLTFAAGRWDAETQKSGQITLKSLEWLPGDIVSPETTYAAYWLTQPGESDYPRLLLTHKPLGELPALSQPTNQPLLESEAIIATTYARDSLWNVDLRPFKLLSGVEMAGANFLVIQGKRYECTPANLGEVLRLLRQPVGQMPIAVPHPGAAGQEEEVRCLAARLEQQLASQKTNLPAGSQPALPYPVISWERAVQLVRSGEVVSVGQHHSLQVGLQTKDGARYYTREPLVDEIIRVVREQAPNARAIAIGTE